MSWRNLTMTLPPGLVAIPVGIDPLISKDAAIKGSEVCATSRQPLSTKKSGGVAVVSYQCGHKHEGPCKKVTGYEMNGEYIVLDEADLAKINDEKDATIKIDHFVPLSEIDPLYFESTYGVRPGKNSQPKAFMMVVEAMAKDKRAGVGRLCLDKKERMVILRYDAERGILLLHQCYFDAQIKRGLVADIKASMPDLKLTKEEREMMKNVITISLGGTFTPEAITDERMVRLEKLLAQGAESAGAVKPIVVEPEDLLAKLQATLDNGKKKPRAKKVA